LAFATNSANIVDPMFDFIVQGELNDALAAELHDHAPDAFFLRQPRRARLSGLARVDVLGEWAEARGLDWAWTRGTLRASDFRVLAMDMDSTLIVIECIDELAKLAGVGPEVAKITEAAMRGELDFQGALRRRVNLLKGLPVSALEEVYRDRLRLSPGAEGLLAGARRLGWKTLLVSGGFTFFTEKLKERLGLDFTLANHLEADDGHLTGQIVGPIVDGAAKEARLRSVCADCGVPPARAVVIGDGANDLPMIRVAGLGVAFRAKPIVRREAAAAVNHGGLETVLGFLE
jgi:phosphoserine phosphatase